MMLFTGTIGVEANPGTRIRDVVSPKVPLKTKYCGKSHDQGSCPAFGKECAKCGRKNHFKSVCKSGSNDKHDSNHSRSKKVRVAKEKNPIK